MDNIIVQINRIRKRISKSSGCSYLYRYFDDLVRSLQNRQEPLSIAESSELIDLICDYARDSRYNNFASANWVRYSARCFYCADFLLNYLADTHTAGLKRTLNQYFMELVDSGVALIIPQDVVDKYLENNINPENHKNFYNHILDNAISQCHRSRLWRGSEVTLARDYTKAVDYYIRQYIEKYSDYSMLKIWIPMLNTRHVAKFWYEYPESGNYRHCGNYERECIENSLDAMLDVHLELFNLWYEYNAQEVIDVMPIDDLIEIMEVLDDEVFENILKNISGLPKSEKIKSVLEHFMEDDEAWVVNLSKMLFNTFYR